jgi:hypothetical protein
MNAETAPPATDQPSRRRLSPLVWTALLLVVVLAVIFRESFDSRYVAFSNDGPLGQMASEENKMPSLLKGLWVDLNWLGNEGLSPAPDITTALRWLTTPRVFLNAFYPLALFIAGLGACYCLRQFKLSPMACILGGLAAALNSDFFSTCCWGVASQIICFGANYFAIGLLVSSSPRHKWLRVVLAGLAVGLGVTEAYDIGAIFSLFVAAFVIFQALFLTESREVLPAKLGKGVLGTAVIAVFAALVAVHTLPLLIGTQIQGVVGTAQDKETKEKHWDIATQWSLPKAEITQLFIPGIFGYRMESTNGDNYWGQIGRSPTLDPILKQRETADGEGKERIDRYLNNSNLWRFSGTGLYAGVLVLLVALWAVLQSFRATRSPYSLLQRRIIWFWTAVLVVTVLLSFGRYAPFYQFFYALPYASTIRNPVKFMHVFSWVLIIVFGYGADGLYRVYMRDAAVRTGGWRAQFKKWLAAASPFEKWWLRGSFVAIAAALAGWLIYASANDRLRDHIASIGIDPHIAPGDAKFSLHAVGWFVLFLVASLALLAVIFSGAFAGSRAKWGGVLLGALLVIDLVHADAPWPRYWNVAFKYASNPVVDLLKDKPWEHRVAMNPIARTGNPQFDLFQQVYTTEWQQQVFPYYDIQSLEVVMESRVAVDKDRFLRALPGNDNLMSIKRLWELTNTRFLVGMGGGVADFLNQNMDPVTKRFRVAMSFNLTTKPGASGLVVADYTAAPDPQGELALIEFTGALPRASLFANWVMNTNDDATLQTIANPEFDPHQIVLVATNLPASGPLSTNSPGSVEITDYKSKRIELSADVKTPAVLLLVDRYNPKWLAEVDGKPAPLLRCDFILRGVYLEPGPHKIVMRYVTPINTLYVSGAAILLGIVLSGILLVDGCSQRDDSESAKQPGVTIRSGDAGTTRAA